MPQGRGTFVDLSVEDNLRIGAYSRKDAEVALDIDKWYDHAVANGAVGGKVIGAGGGGFLMFYASDKTKLRHAMRQTGLTEVRFRFDFEGTKVVIQ